MATTSPDNIRTPDPGDPYNLVADLATLAGDVQTALNLRDQNVLKGTSAQRAVAESTAAEGMLWQDTDSIKMIWRKDGAAWVPAVWRWSGTTAQMNSFGANAPDGFEWFNTTDNSEYARLGGLWNRATGELNTRIPSPQALSGSWSMLTGLAAVDNTAGATVSGGVVTMNHPGNIMLAAYFQHTGSSSTSMSTAVTHNSAAAPTTSTTVIDAAVTANGAVWSVPMRVAAGDTFRMWMAGIGVSANVSKTGLRIMYV